MEWREHFELQMEPSSLFEICSNQHFQVPADFCNSSPISRVAPAVLSSPCLPVDGAEVFQARPSMSLSQLVCEKPQVEEYFCCSKCSLVLNEMPVFHKAGSVPRAS